MKSYNRNLSSPAAKIFGLVLCLAVMAASLMQVYAQKENKNKVISQAPEVVSVDDSSGNSNKLINELVTQNNRGAVSVMPA
jgi:hypothetical protein